MTKFILRGSLYTSNDFSITAERSFFVYIRRLEIVRSVSKDTSKDTQALRKRSGNN